MKLTDFDIDFIKFSNEEYSFRYRIGDTFFDLKENSLIQHGQLDCEINCRKYETTINLDFKINGVITTDCERCLNNINLPIKSTHSEVARLTGSTKLVDDENFISVNNQVFNIYDSIYENICLALPSRKICENSSLNKQCEIKYNEPSDTEEKIDDRWSELKKLKL